MKQYIGYIRVSTVKQGTHGVSLQEQKAAISDYAGRNQFPISVWLEEMETAAKQGRPIFKQALKLLRDDKAQGIILHKLDRGARNLKDWAAIGELSDQGVEVHFVNESLDLHSRGGRLSADIQAVVAADYIRNLREETRKGFYGRLKQGFYPLRAPIGYLDQGGGKPKTIDPIMGPLVRKGFELYGTGRYNLDTLREELYRSGLRNRNGGRMSQTGISTLLNNSFYIGIIHIRPTNENFVGIHEPLITKAQFDRVQAVLTGKTNGNLQRHAFLYRRMLSCATCEYSLIGERQKGHVYYRCHNSECHTAIREESVEAAVIQMLRALRFNEAEKKFFKARVLELKTSWKSQQEDEARSLNLRLGQIKDRLNPLTDAFLDRALDKPMFEERKEALFLDQKTIEEKIVNLSSQIGSQQDRLEKFLELAGNALLSHQNANSEEKREILEIVTSNRTVAGKSLDLKPRIAFQEVINRFENTEGGPNRDTPRTLDRLLDTLAKLNTQGELPDVTSLFRFRDNNSKKEILRKDGRFAEKSNF